MNEDEIKNYKGYIDRWFAQGVKFDSAFNLGTDDKMYCSEMIKKGLARATNNRIAIATTKPTKEEAQFFATHLHMPFDYMNKLHVIAIDNLFLNPHCRLIKRFDFNAKP
jgi:hypothetical protein